MHGTEYRSCGRLLEAIHFCMGHVQPDWCTRHLHSCPILVCDAGVEKASHPSKSHEPSAKVCTGLNPDDERELYDAKQCQKKGLGRIPMRFVGGSYCESRYYVRNISEQCQQSSSLPYHPPPQHEASRRLRCALGRKAALTCSLKAGYS